MGKYIPIICLALIMIFPMSSFATTSTKTEDELKYKITATEQYEKDGTNKMIQEKMEQYYENNEIIDYNKITDLDSAEAQKLIKKIEKAMIDYSEGKYSSKSLGSDPVIGTNTIDFSDFINADMILVHDGQCPYGYWRHSGTYEAITGKFISAQIANQGNGVGVIREPKSFYRGYDEATGQWVNDVANSMRLETRSNIMNYLGNQIGDGYKFSSYYNRDTWYCSKLPWVGWQEFYNTNLNWLGGICSPDDLHHTTLTFVHSY